MHQWSQSVPFKRSHLLGQDWRLHCLISSLSPWQSSAKLPSGTIQSRTCLCIPVSQDLLHWLHGFHAPHWPATSITPNRIIYINTSVRNTTKANQKIEKEIFILRIPPETSLTWDYCNTTLLRCSASCCTWNRLDFCMFYYNKPVRAFEFSEYSISQNTVSRCLSIWCCFVPISYVKQHGILNYATHFWPTFDPLKSHWNDRLCGGAQLIRSQM